MPSKCIRRNLRSGRSSVELIMGLLVFGLIAAIAIPRLGRARAADATADVQLRRSLHVLRTAIELYHRDHGIWPGNLPTGAGQPDAVERLFLSQLCGFTDSQGLALQNSRTGPCFGPYIWDRFPACPLGPAAGQTRLMIVDSDGNASTTAASPEFGWIYNRRTGEIAVNCTQSDASGISYASY